MTRLQALGLLVAISGLILGIFFGDARVGLIYDWIALVLIPIGIVLLAFSGKREERDETNE